MWLNPEVSFMECFREIQKEKKIYKGLKFYEVGDLVNSIKHDKPECILSKKEYEDLLHKRGLGQYFTKVSEQQPQSQLTQPVTQGEKINESKGEGKEIVEDKIQKYDTVGLKRTSAMAKEVEGVANP